MRSLHLTGNVGAPLPLGLFCALLLLEMETHALHLLLMLLLEQLALRLYGRIRPKLFIGKIL
jgi:hypothetical protein